MLLALLPAYHITIDFEKRHHGRVIALNRLLGPVRMLIAGLHQSDEGMMWASLSQTLHLTNWKAVLAGKPQYWKYMEFLNKRVLVTIGKNDAPRMTCVNAISPNGAYVNLEGRGQFDEAIGWVRLDECKFLDVIGPSDELASKFMARLSTPK